VDSQAAAGPHQARMEFTSDDGGLSDKASMAITIRATLEGTDWFLTDSIP